MFKLPDTLLIYSVCKELKGDYFLFKLKENLY